MEETKPKRRGRPTKYHGKRTAVIITMNTDEKHHFEELAFSEKYMSFTEFVVACLREHASFAKSAEELEAQVETLSAEAKQHQALAQQKQEQAEQSQARIRAMRIFAQRTDVMYRKALDKAVGHVVLAMDKHNEKMIAEGQARALREDFAVGLSTEDLLAKAYEQARTKGMLR